MFEKVLKKVSAFASLMVVWIVCCGFYLSLKGFEYDGNGSFILNSAIAAQNETELTENIPLNFVFPQDYVLGDKKAPVTIYEYSSFGCFHCAEFHENVLPEIKKVYVDKGKVKLIFVPLPADKNSMDAALLAECVGKDRYFEFIDLLFKKQRDWTLAFNPLKKLKQYAGLSGIGSENMEKCLKNDEVATRILRDRQDAILMLKIKGTPSFVVSSKNESVMISGNKKFEDFAQLIDGQIAKSEKK